ncbi:hypothetical protein ABKN59_004132 [Abortiporus biennis]
MSTTDLARQVQQILKSSPDAPSLPTLLQHVDEFVLECSASPDSEGVLHQFEDELQQVLKVVDHANLSQTEIVLAIIFHLRPILLSSSVISNWFELVLRPALREPKLPTPSVDYAKELILNALDPGSNNVPGDSEKAKEREKVGNFRRRLMDFYLLDAYNESSGEDVLEWAELDNLQREKKACWKANLEDILVRVGLQWPQDLLTELYHCFASPSSRVQLLMLITAYTSQPTFATRAAAVMARHPIVQSLLNSLIHDNSSTAFTIGLTVFTKLLPIFAVHASEDLKQILPQLLIVLARIICWKSRTATMNSYKLPTNLGLQPDEVKEIFEDDVSDEDDAGIGNKLPIRPDLEWQCLDIVFAVSFSFPPSPQRFFSFLYYLFPCNVLRFLRFPILYLTEHDVENPFAVSWEEALDEDMIRSKSESILRGHIVHPLLIWRDATTELSNPDFWAQYDIPRIVGECTMLDTRHAAIGIRERSPTSFQPSSFLSQQISTSESPTTTAPALSSSTGSSVSSVVAHVPSAHSAAKHRISVQDMIATSVALKSGLEIEIVDPVPSWSSNFFQRPDTRTRSPSRDLRTTSSRTVTPDHPRRAYVQDEIPTHITQALAGLQREVLLLRSELNFELWMARENVRHIGRLYQDRVVSKNAEMERQGLHNKMKELKNEVYKLQKQLQDHKGESSRLKNQFADWNKRLQDKLRDLRAEKNSWNAEATALRAADKEAKDTFAAQGKLLAEATNKVFQLETQIKENAHKVERLHDYERQIEQFIKMQRLWESDVHQLNDQTETLKAYTSGYKKMELRVDTYEKTQAQMEEDAKLRRLQIESLEARLNITQQRLAAARKQPSAADLSHYREECARLREGNTRLQDENIVLRDEVEELKSMVEYLKVQVSGGRTGLISSPRQSPLIPSASLNL